MTEPRCEDVPAHWRVCAEAWLDDVVEHGDANGTIANLTGDDLRDVLMVAGEQIRLLHGALSEATIGLEGWLEHGRKVHEDRYPATEAIIEGCRALLIDRTGRGRGGAYFGGHNAGGGA